MKIRALFFLLFVNLTLLTAQVPHVKDRDHYHLTEWNFKKGLIYRAHTVDLDDSEWDTVTSPHTYSMDAINEVGYYRGVAWYRTKTIIPERMQGKRIFVRFEGVGQEAIVYINGQKVGKHIGGYSAFCYEMTDKVKVGDENTVVVRVSNAPNFKRIPVNDALFNHYGGIYRPVQIFSTPETAVSPAYHGSSGVFVELKKLTKESAEIEVRTHVNSLKESRQAQLAFRVTDSEGNELVSESSSVDLQQGDSILTNLFQIKNAILWNGRKNPHLYKLEVQLTNNQLTDKVSQNFGLRTFSIDPEKGFTLNNEPYRVYGVAMHQEWKQYGPALQSEQHETDMMMIDELGATGVRLSHYQHSDKTYQLADELGLLVWSEIPFVHDHSGREGGNARQQLTELILQNYNHPSVYTWGLWNEVRSWKGPDEACVVITKGLNKLAHELDATRVTSSASDRGMKSNMGYLSDLQAWNKYYGWYYGEYGDMATWLDESRRDYPEVALGVSEYGVGGNILQQDVSKIEKPVGNYFPEQVQTEYHEITWRIIKDRPFVWSSYIWNMFDFSVASWNRGGVNNLNHKGLVTYDRKEKKDAFYFYKANWSEEPVLHIAEVRHTNRTEAHTPVKVFTNLDKVTLILNGKKIKALSKTNDLNTLVFKNIVLQEGQNTIQVKGKKGKEVFVHEAVWQLKTDGDE